MEIDVEYIAKLGWVLETLYKAGAEHAVVAGGAIRDMLFKKPIKDIDVFYTGTLDTAELKELYTQVVPCDVKYEDSAFTITHEVFTKDRFPCWIQLIQLKDNVLGTIAKFPTAVGRAYYDGEVLEGITQELLLAEHNKTIWFDQPCDMKYYQKYVDKYGEYLLKFLSPAFMPKEMNPTILYTPQCTIFDELESPEFNV